MDGMIPHKDINSNKKYYFKRDRAEHRYILPKPLMQSFANKQITCIEYDALTDDQEREIFQRVQLGVALTVAERMQSIPGPWPSLIREVQSLVLGDAGFGEDLDWGRDRGKDFQCLATIICLINSHPNIVFPTSGKLERWLSSTTPVPSQIRAEVLETFQIFITLVKGKKYNAAFSKPSRVSPVEFTMIGLLIYALRHTHSLKQLSSAIWLMRADVRKKFDDIRANSKVTKVMLDFLRKGLKDAEVVSDGKGDTPAAVFIKKKFPNGHMRAAENDLTEPTPPIKEEKRRKRPEPPGGDESDYEDAPPKRRVSMPQPSSSRATNATAATKVRKVSAPIPTKASGTKPGPKPNPSKTAQEAESSLPLTAISTSSQSSVPLAAKSSTARITSRTTRTALSAAADAFFLPGAGGSSALQAKLPTGRISKKAVEPESVSEPVVKMEVDTPTMSGVSDENAMVIDAVSPTSEVGHTNADASGSRMTSISIVNSPDPSASGPGQSDQVALEKLLVDHGYAITSVSIQARASPATTNSTLVPVLPPPPPSISAPPAFGPSEGSSVSVQLEKQISTSSHDTHAPPSRNERDRNRDRERDYSSDGDWNVDRSRDRDRYHDRERDRDRDYGDRDRENGRGRDRDRDWEHDRRKERGWERPDRDWKRRERSRDRTREREPSRYRRNTTQDWRRGGR